MKKGIHIAGLCSTPEWGWEDCNYYHGFITKEKFEKIERLAEEVKRLGVFSIQTEDDGVCPVSSLRKSEVPRGTLLVDAEREDLEYTDDSAAETAFPYYGMKLVVTDDSFYWRWFAHPSGGAESTLIFISEARKAFVGGPKQKKS